MLKWLCGILVVLLLLPFSVMAFELQPLTTRNLSPAVIGFGLPALGAAKVLAAGQGRTQLGLDLVNNFSEADSGTESLRFDGETYRLALSADYGIAKDFEIGAELPLIRHDGGFLDDFIEGWHRTFGLPQGERDRAPSGRLDYRYSQAGQGFGVQSQRSGIGDLALRVAWQCWRDPTKSRALALRTSLKLPTGSARRLTGSGSTDLAIWLSAEQRSRPTIGPVTLYGGGGVLLSTDGDLLANQRRNLAGLLSLGLAWQPWSQLGFQLQFDGHSPLYVKSELRELNQFAGQLAMGGSFALNPATVVELAVVEDVIVNTAPDVVFHLAVKRAF